MAECVFALMAVRRRHRRAPGCSPTEIAPEIEIEIAATTIHEQNRS